MDDNGSQSANSDDFSARSKDFNEGFTRGFDQAFEEAQGPTAVTKPRRTKLVSSTKSWVLALTFGLLIPLFCNGFLAHLMESFQPLSIIPELETSGSSLSDMQKGTVNAIAIIWATAALYLWVIIYQVRVVATAYSWMSAAFALLFTLITPVFVTIILPLAIEAYL